MIDRLIALLRRVAAVAALVFGVLLAALFAALALAAALAIGAAAWLAHRFGLRATRPPPAARGQDVIDVEMREVEPGEVEPGEDAAQRDTPPASPTQPTDEANRHD